MMNLELFSISQHSIILIALQKIDANTKGFLVVVDKENRAIGIVTDGDLRRSFIKGKTINDSIEDIVNTQFKYVSVNSTFEEVTEKFKSSRINFLPVLDHSRKLVNVITKKQFHVSMIEDIDTDLLYDFTALDETKLEHEIYSRPWGFYKTTFLNQHTRAKIIKIYPQGELSLQEHKKREEHWVIIKGEGKLTLGDSVKHVSPGDYIFIPRACKHRICNESTKETLMISEVQLGNYFGEDDIVRFEDKYKRRGNER